MFDKMLVFLSLVLSIQPVKTCKIKGTLRTDLKDCTKNFTNRIASFESGLLPGEWMLPRMDACQNGCRGGPSVFPTSTAVVMTDTKFHWFLHACGSGKVCMEAKKNGWEDYYITDTRRTNAELIRDTNLYGGPNEKKEVEIWCTSCEPERDSLTYSDCQLFMNHQYPEGVEREMLGLFESGLVTSNVVSRMKEGSSDAVKWRILSPQTRQWFEPALAADNCAGLADLPSSYTVTSSITRTESTGETTEVSAKMTYGREALKVLKVLSVEAELKHTWSSSSTTAAAEGRTTVLGAGSAAHIVKPGYKWIVKQFIGQVGYTKIKTLHISSEDVKCT